MVLTVRSEVLVAMNMSMEDELRRLQLNFGIHIINGIASSSRGQLR
jgi:hypothetical protein